MVSELSDCSIRSHHILREFQSFSQYLPSFHVSSFQPSGRYRTVSNRPLSPLPSPSFAVDDEVFPHWFVAQLAASASVSTLCFASHKTSRFKLQRISRTLSVPFSRSFATFTRRSKSL